jgi:hypothetical protein
MFKTCVFAFLNILISVHFIYSQDFDKNFFKSPVDFPILLAGNFGEIRPNHFHTGIDVKVPKSGIKLYAAADGYVSRIRKNAGGYGNVLYITHPNGLMTVYGHMQKFNDTLENYSSNIQYKNNQFEFCDYPDSSLFPVKKGELIGYAGNSGRSFGPHLHFEIREAEKDIPINPLIFNLGIQDQSSPEIYNLIAYPLSGSSEIKDKKNKVKFKVSKVRNSYSINDIINYTGKIGFSIQTNDLMDKVPNMQGVYSLKMYLDQKLIYALKMDKMSFYNTRYVNSFIDYEERQSTGLKFIKLFTEPGNKLDIYYETVNDGIIEAQDNDIHTIKILANDNFNNSSVLTFKIKGIPIVENPVDESNMLKFDEDNYIIENEFRAIIPKGSLYKNIQSSYIQIPQKTGYLSNIHQLNSELVPLHFEIEIAIKPNEIPSNLIPKALIVNIKEDNKCIPLESFMMNEFMIAKSMNFGIFAVVVDTIPPDIFRVEDKEKKNDTSLKEISYFITDDLSGISSYNAEIDGNPVIFEYDLKNNKISYYFDNHIIYNKLHTLTLSVFDKKNNNTVIQTEFFK